MHLILSLILHLFLSLLLHMHPVVSPIILNTTVSPQPRTPSYSHSLIRYERFSCKSRVLQKNSLYCPRLNFIEVIFIVFCLPNSKPNLHLHASSLVHTQYTSLPTLPYPTLHTHTRLIHTTQPRALFMALRWQDAAVVHDPQHLHGELPSRVQPSKRARHRHVHHDWREAPRSAY